jgi:hypothetical protein
VNRGWFGHRLLPQNGTASGKTGDYANLISLLRSRADRRGECSIMTIPSEPAGSIPKPPPFEAAHRHLSLYGRTSRARAEFGLHSPMAGTRCASA